MTEKAARIDEDVALKASDVRENAGLSYRQLNDWESRGALPEDDDRGAGWRNYTPREVFVVMVMSELRKQYGIPVEKLKYIKDFMLQEGADHFRYCIEKISLLGTSIWLITDFDETFLLDTELEISDMFSLGYFHTEKQKGYCLLNLTPLVQRLVKTLKPDVDLELTDSGFQLRAAVRKGTTIQNNLEAQLLKHVRTEDITKIEIAMDSGEIKTLKVSQDRDVNSDVNDLLAQSDFQNILITHRDGETVRIEQTFTQKGKS
ncbi:MAG: MerR family transcriptional regulator [Acidimicrobiia bacterium]|nr:MerR family transcriptional regulator [Acidimicrobiia bacterium]